MVTQIVLVTLLRLKGDHVYKQARGHCEGPHEPRVNEKLVKSQKKSVGEGDLEAGQLWKVLE